MTQNAFGGGPRWDIRRQLLARRIARVAPDVVGLQEIHASDTSGARSQAHELASLVGGYHVDFAPARVAPTGACEGVALLCRDEFRERFVEALTLDPADFFDRAGQRVVLGATIDFAEGPIDVFVTHLSLSRRARERTVRELLAFTARERARSKSLGALLVGDLNALPEEDAIAALARCPASQGGPWRDAWTRDATRGRGATWPSIVPFRRLDYVFVQPESTWDVRAAELEPVSGSDHRGVVVKARVR
jgi:endonuclease/exonuclease/phosphatase family metal-dependent hydrolase